MSKPRSHFYIGHDAKGMQFLPKVGTRAPGPLSTGRQKLVALCAIHHTPLACARCIGAKGGKKKSAAKTRAARKNAKRPRPGARKDGQ